MRYKKRALTLHYTRVILITRPRQKKNHRLVPHSMHFILRQGQAEEEEEEEDLLDENVVFGESDGDAIGGF